MHKFGCVIIESLLDQLASQGHSFAAGIVTGEQSQIPVVFLGFCGQLFDLIGAESFYIHNLSDLSVVLRIGENHL